MVEHATKGSKRRIYVIATAVTLLAAAAAVIVLLATSAPPKSARQAGRGTPPTQGAPTSSAVQTETATTVPAAQAPAPAPAPAPGFVPHRVTAVGDSVMLDYQQPLESDISGVAVYAAVSEQWSTGVAEVQQLKADGQLGADVIVGLGTNGPITDADFDAMMAILQGASRVVFVNIHVDRPWQDSNNAVIARGAARYPRAFVADWASLASQNPQWFGSDGTHLAVDGPGAQALASLVAATLTSG